MCLPNSAAVGPIISGIGRVPARLARASLLPLSLAQLKALFQQFDHRHALADSVPLELSFEFGRDFEVERFGIRCGGG